MPLSRILAPFALLLALAGVAPAQDKKGPGDPPPLSVAKGVVEQADKDTLTVKPRGPDGKFQKALALKVTGTSKVAVLVPQARGEKVVLTQREVAAKDLVAGQQIAAVYAEAGPDGAVLLTAVAHPAPAK